MDAFNSLGLDTRSFFESLGKLLLFFFLLPTLLQLALIALRRGESTFYSLRRIFRRRYSYRSTRAHAYRPKFYGHRRYNVSSRKFTKEDLQRLSLSSSGKIFRPWRWDYLKSFALWVIAVSWLVSAILWYRQEQNYYICAIAMLSVIPLYFGFTSFERAQKRKHGKNLEGAAIRFFTKLKPEAWDVVPNQLLKSHGDIDLTVRLHNDDLCVIEIKSWHRWNGYLRTKRALNQVLRQRRAIKAAYSVIWLPHSRSAFAEFRDGVFVVGGNTRYLLAELPNIIRYPTIIKFSMRPPDDLLSFIKARNFHWNKAALHWEGECCEQEADELRQQVENEGGFIVLEGSEIEYEYADERESA